MTDIEIVDPLIEAYAVAHSTPEPPRFAELADQTRARTSAPGMMVGTLEGRLLTAVVAMLRPMTVLEIGTFTGYSSLSMAEALPPGGHIVTCDISEEHVAIAREHVSASPYADRIEFRVGPAIETLESLSGPFDLVFIDADKTGYVDYYEAVLPKLSERGLIVVDNTLWDGDVLDPGDDETTQALADFNDRVAGDERVVSAMLTVRDGVTLIPRSDAVVA